MTDENLPAEKSERPADITNRDAAERAASDVVELTGFWAELIESSLARINGILWELVKMFLLIVVAVFGYVGASIALEAFGTYVGGLP